MSPLPRFAFDNTYARDLQGLYIRWEPEASPKPDLVCLNAPLAQALQLNPDELAGPQGLAILSGNVVPDGATPLAQAYAGHQFGGFSPRLGDGRALLLGEVIDCRGQRRDIAFKGSGRTPFSRNGDGKCALGPALREYLISEAMAALGIPTTRSLAVVTTGAKVHREKPLPGAILTRVAASHIRVGSFEFCSAHQGPEAIESLANYVILRHYPHLADHPQPHPALLEAVVDRQAELVARWLGVGFIHGVMNTDNMTLSGETIDYGPCAFMEAYHPDTVFSSIDTQGRYAYGNQADIAQWNLARFAETLLPLIDPDTDRAIELATAAIMDFTRQHATHWLSVMRNKLGLDESGEIAGDTALARDYLALLQGRQVDFTNAFRDLYDRASGPSSHPGAIFAADDSTHQAWLHRWQSRQPQRTPDQLEAMAKANPWIIPRNHLVENALEAAVKHRDMAPSERLLAAVQHPCETREADRDYTLPATAEFTAHYQTFCGT